MSLYTIEYNGKTLGAYIEYSEAELFIKSCLFNNLMTDCATICEYRANSCMLENRHIIRINNMKVNEMKKVEEKKVEDTKIVENKVVENKVVENKVVEETKQSIPSIDYMDPKVIDIARKKLELHHRINILKVQKQKIEESKQVYENDIKLYKTFSENLLKDSNFIIPELFLEKYNLMKKLDNNNNLSWESFVKEYKTTNFYGDYFGTNNYEDMFINSEENESVESNLSEEFDIESDSDTESSVE
jgi:hypothetical protein